MANINNTTGRMRFFRDNEEIYPESFKKETLEKLGEKIAYGKRGCIYPDGTFIMGGKWSLCSSSTENLHPRSALIDFMRENTLSEIEIIYDDEGRDRDLIDIARFELDSFDMTLFIS